MVELNLIITDEDSSELVMLVRLDWIVGWDTYIVVQIQ